MGQLGTASSAWLENLLLENHCQVPLPTHHCPPCWLMLSLNSSNNKWPELWTGQSLAEWQWQWWQWMYVKIGSPQSPPLLYTQPTCLLAHLHGLPSGVKSLAATTTLCSATCLLSPLPLSLASHDELFPWQIGHVELSCNELAVVSWQRQLGSRELATVNWPRRTGHAELS